MIKLKTMHADLSTYDKRGYHPGPFWKRFLWYGANALFLKCSLNPFSGMKVALLRLFGARVGKGVVIKPCVNIKYPWFLTLGDHCWIGEEVWIDNLAQVTLGRDVCLSQGAFLLCGNHDYGKPGFDLKTGEITLEQGSWIGARGVVGPGVTCHSHAVLTAGSVATRDLEPFSVYRGNPAVKIRDRVIG